LFDSREEEERNEAYVVVDVTESLWSLDADSNAAGQKVQLLAVNLVRPPPTSEEVMWKKGALKWRQFGMPRHNAASARQSRG
jgi:hypothetical protein